MFRDFGTRKDLLFAASPELIFFTYYFRKTFIKILLKK